MSEYWVSQPKFYCKFCNCHIADNKPSKQFHENGAKHKEKVELFNKQQRDQKLHGARSEQDLQRQLAEIERAAKAAIVADKAQTDLTFFSNSGISYAPPPPAPRPPSGLPPGYRPKEEEVIEEENSGIYSIRGRTYLDGKIFENKINVGVKCEIFIENIDEWISGEVVRRMETEVPNTKVTIKSFDVSYSIPIPDTDKLQVVNERRVKSDRIRLMVNDEGEVLLDEQQTDEQNKGPLLNENTGLGIWQTVSVRTVDEEKEWMEHQAAREAMSHDHNQSAVFGSTTSSSVKKVDSDTTHLDVDSAMGAYDPFRTGIYKGVRVSDLDQYNISKLNSITYGEKVEFKKRRVEVSCDNGSAVTANESKASGSEEQTATPGSSALEVGVVVRKVGGARNFRRKPLLD